MYAIIAYLIWKPNIMLTQFLILTMIKAEFKRRLIKLQSALNRSLEFDKLSADFLPYLYQVICYMWCKNISDFENKRRSK